MTHATNFTTFFTKISSDATRTYYPRTFSTNNSYFSRSVISRNKISSHPTQHCSLHLHHPDLVDIPEIRFLLTQKDIRKDIILSIAHNNVFHILKTTSVRSHNIGFPSQFFHSQGSNYTNTVGNDSVLISMTPDISFYNNCLNCCNTIYDNSPFVPLTPINIPLNMTTLTSPSPFICGNTQNGSH